MGVLATPPGNTSGLVNKPNGGVASISRPKLKDLAITDTACGGSSTHVNCLLYGEVPPPSQ